MLTTEDYPRMVKASEPEFDKPEESEFQKILDNLGYGFTVDIQTYSFYDEDDYRYRFTIYPDRIGITDMADGRTIVLDMDKIDLLSLKDKIPAKQIFRLVVNLSKKKFCEGMDQ